MSESVHHQFHRAALPEILFGSDLSIALQIPEEDVDRAVLAGECGPYFRVAGRLAVRREALLAALAERERHVLPLPDDAPDRGRP